MYMWPLVIVLLPLCAISSPVHYLAGIQPQSGASLTVLDDLTCPGIPTYSAWTDIDRIEAGNGTIANQTVYASAAQTQALQPEDLSAPHFLGAPRQTCLRLRSEAIFSYRASSYNFPQVLLSPEDKRNFAFRFSCSGHYIYVGITGRPHSAPDSPESYSHIANEAFVADLRNTIYFKIAKPMWVKIHTEFGTTSGGSTCKFELFQIDLLP